LRLHDSLVCGGPLACNSMRRIIAGIIVIPIAIIAVIVRAQASAGVSCRAEDASAKFGIFSAFGRGLGGGMVNFGATLQILTPAVPPDLRTLKFERSEVSLVWFYDHDIKFQLHHERPVDGPSGYVDLVIETKQNRNDESLYRGGYMLRVNYLDTKQGGQEKSLELRGSVECSVD
jgi:hypothetical protein